MQQIDQHTYQVLTEVIQEQMAIFGPEIALLKARKVQGMTITDAGKVTEINKEPQAATEQLMSQFRELSEAVVKKTMEPKLKI